MMRELEAAFEITSDDVATIAAAIGSEMQKGLEEDGQALKMIPSFVEQLPSGDETGDVFAIDLGGTNLRCLRVSLLGGRKIGKVDQRSTAIPQSVMKGHGHELFDCIAQEFVRFVSDLCGDDCTTIQRFVSFTFSFPVTQTALDNGRLICWTKGFDAAGVVGEDVVACLNDAFGRMDTAVRCSALINDTVGTLCSLHYEQDCQMGIILGTGTNACYIERVDNISKLKTGATYANCQINGNVMVINTEWGAFDGDRAVLRYNEYVTVGVSDVTMCVINVLYAGMIL